MALAMQHARRGLATTPARRGSEAGSSERGGSTMRRVTVIGLTALVLISAPIVPVSAQKPDGASSGVQLELKRQRTVVPPPVDAGAAAREAEEAARRLDEQRRADELIRKATPRLTPPLDESVVEGSRAKQLQEQQKR
jgi:hypothetical protein